MKQVLTWCLSYHAPRLKVFKADATVGVSSFERAFRVPHLKDEPVKLSKDSLFQLVMAALGLLSSYYELDLLECW